MLHRWFIRLGVFPYAVSTWAVTVSGLSVSEWLSGVMSGYLTVWFVCFRDSVVFVGAGLGRWGW